jgi:N-acetylglucosaminyldiphosphoundecaprenol N-acetyl-beta-D-mannosaminyltransferase
MIDRGRKNLLGIGIDAVDYEAAVDRIITAAGQGRTCSVSALAVHGVMTGHTDEEHRVRLRGLDLVVPDGQPVRWALNALYGVNLPDRVYGPTLTLRVCEAAAREGLPVYLYGSRPEVLAAFQENLAGQFPGLRIAGAEPSKFRQLNETEKAEVVERIKASGAKITLVGLGCPRQEVWAYEYRDCLSMPIMAVGAAFDFHAGTLSQAPAWMQDRGLEWLYRLRTEPRRLWRRYLILNPWYVYLVLAQRLGVRRFGTPEPLEPASLSYG